MKKFSYKAKDWSGKTVKGELEAMTRNEAMESIKANGLVLLSLDEKKLGGLGGLFGNVGGIGVKQTANFTRQLATMMKAGLAITEALSLLKNQNQKGVMNLVINDALNEVRGGQPLAAALDKYKKYFGEAYVASLAAGEEGGVLEEVLLKLADNLENESEFRGKVKGAMIYPIIVIIGMLAVVFIMMVFVIPKLTSMYGEFGSEMPAITRALMAVSGIMTKLWFLFPAIPIGIIALIRTADTNPKLKLKKDRVMLRIPIMGELNRKTIVANTTRSLSMLLTAGISLVEALKIVANVAGNEVYKQAFLDIALKVEKGFPMSDCFEETGVFPLIVTQMVATGEATGKLDEVLMRVSDYFSGEAEESVKTLTAAIEPIIMVVLGIGVAFLVVAMIMPIYNLTSKF